MEGRRELRQKKAISDPSKNYGQLPNIKRKIYIVIKYEKAMLKNTVF